MTESTQNKTPRSLLLVVLAGAFSLVAVLGVALVANIATHKQEAKTPAVRVVELTEEIDDPAVWGQNYPLEYDTWKKTAEMTPTRYGGSEAMPRIPTTDDPRENVSRSKIDADPRLKTIWAGYAFATDFRERRGHA